MERDIFTKEAVYSRLEKDFILVSQYTDRTDNRVPAENLLRYTQGSSFAVPLYIVTDTKGVEIARLVPPTNIASLSADQFVAFLDGAKAKFAASR